MTRPGCWRQERRHDAQTANGCDTNGAARSWAKKGRVRAQAVMRRLLIVGIEYNDRHAGSKKSLDTQRKKAWNDGWPEAKEREIRRNQAAEELGEGRWTNGELREDSEEDRKKRVSIRRGKLGY